MKQPIRESDIQCSIVEYLRAFAPDVFVFAVPEAGARARGGRSGNVIAGLTPGVPSLVLLLPSMPTLWQGEILFPPEPRPAFIKVKRPGGKLSEAETDFLNELTYRHVLSVVAYSVADVRAALKRWGVATRETK